MNDRLDTKGRRVGQRASNGQERTPKRIEAGLCPDLEASLAAVIEQLEYLVISVRGMSKDGCVGTEGVVGLIERIIRIARQGPDQ